MSKPYWTFAMLAALGGSASADPTQLDAASADETIQIQGASPMRNIAKNVLVAPEGGELSASMKFIMSDPSLGGEPLKFTDLGMFSLTGRWAIYSKLELAANVDLLAKQPSFTDEKPWQSAGGSARIPLGDESALSVYGGGGHLIDHVGAWSREGLALEWKKPIEREFLSFDIVGGLDGVTLSAPNARGAFLAEASLQTTALFHDPEGHFGAWIGIGYAIPLQSSGLDPTTNMKLDPQSRLDFHLGTVVAVDKRWDLFADFVVIDRGDLENPATRLPILDGGFDQKQIVFGVSRHFSPPHRTVSPNDSDQASLE
jgi:hypothetical protein